jgi:trigger factor
VSTVTCIVEELPEARAKLTLTVPAGEVMRSVEEAAAKLAPRVKVDGFREGNVPPAMVMSKLGRDAVFEQAFNDSLGLWYAEGVREADVAPIGNPSMAEPVEVPDDGEPFEFSLEVAVRPPAKLPEYEGIEVGRGEPEVDKDAVEHELSVLQERFATLVAVDRHAELGNYVMMDFQGSVDGEIFDGGSANDYVLELGSEQFIPGFEDQLVGTKAGDEVTVKVTFPEDYGNEELSGREAEFAVKVHEVREKEIGELTDEFAQEHLGYDTIQELREEIEQRMEEQAKAEVEREYRWAVVDAIAAKADVEVPKGHIHARAHELWHEMATSLAQRGVDPRAYVQMMGKTEHDFIDELEPDADKTIRREAVIAAVIEEQDIEVSEDDLIEAMTGGDEDQIAAAQEQIEKIREAGREKQLKMDVAGHKAVEFLASKATPIAKDLAETREKMWTPEKGAEETAQQAGGKAEGGLWTPGS